MSLLGANRNPTSKEARWQRLTICWSSIASLGLHHAGFSGCILSPTSCTCLEIEDDANMIRTRPFEPPDRDFVLSLTPRLAIGMRPWRDRELWLKAVEGWLADSLAAHPAAKWVVIAVDERGERVGFTSVTSNEHFTGQRQAYIGELASTEESEGRCVGRALVAACEEWARGSGYRLITLTTGGGNDRAIGFYRHLGYVDEDVSLTKEL